MLERILEAEVMDTPEEAIVYDDMDHAEVNERFVDDMMSVGVLAGDVLDLGTGPARIPLLLCDRHNDVRVVAVDLSPSMLDVARVNIELSPHVDRIMLDHIDAKDLPYEEGRFVAVMSNSIVHHIRDPRSTLAEAVRVCAPGGLLYFRDLRRPDTADEVRRLVDMYAGDENEHAQQLFSDSLRAAFTRNEIREYVTPFGFPALTVQETSDRHWTWCARKPGDRG